MYNGRKKGIIIAIISIVLVIILGIVGLVVYAKTDLFKSNQVLFFKYLGQSINEFRVVENSQMLEIENLKNQMPYTTVGNLKCDMLPNMELNLESKVDKINEKSYTRADLKSNSQNLFTLEYANSNNIYALKSDEIVTAYLGIENNNLKVLAQKLGITDTTVLPDTVEKVELNEILKITEEEKAHIEETYLSVLADTVSKENYTKEKNLAISRQGVTYNATAYRLGLSAEELKQLVIALLTTLKQDSITLNLISTKAKLLGLDNNYTEINNLNREVEKLINELSQGQADPEAGIDIVIYVKSGKVITTDIIIRNEAKINLYGEIKENIIDRYITVENLSADAEYNKIEIKVNETRNVSESGLNIIANMDNEYQINLYVSNIGSAAEGKLNTNYEIAFIQDEIETTINYNQEMTFEDEINDIIELNRTNCGVLNDYTTEQLQVLIQSVMQRITTVLSEKMQVIGLQMNQGTVDINNNIEISID